MAGRRAARRTALVLLYQWDVTGQELAEIAKEVESQLQQAKREAES